MKRFLPAVVAFCLTFFGSTAFCQTVVDTFANPGTFIWVCPFGVQSVTVQMWGGGGQGNQYYSGGGGAFTQSTIPVTAGLAYTIRVAHGAVSTPFLTHDSLNTTFGPQGNVLAYANGAGYISWTAPIDYNAQGNYLGGGAEWGAIR